ncbi:MAG: [FeFe] hydrogenase H-cluster maturation GTPase HydF [Bacillota bacterium]|jgi:[FeFe] hydrogenase H-cluster maturation GTPase HydF
MQQTPKANRLHIAIFGRRNVGKSSLINALANQDLALVTPVPGTTADPVYKSMELPALGPVVFIDTAGIDDEGSLGELRVKKTREALSQADLALLVFSGENQDLALEEEWLKQLREQQPPLPVIGVLNKIDLFPADPEKLKKRLSLPVVPVSAKSKENLERLRQAIEKEAPKDYERASIVGDLLPAQSTVVLVTPQDIQAPKGRLILPQVQTIRDLLDHRMITLIVQETELEKAMQILSTKARLVITDSQIFHQVKEIVPREIPLTSFSILMARYKGDLPTLAAGARAIGLLEPGDQVLIAEACTHHPLEQDLARAKLPFWLQKKVGGPLDIQVAAGRDFPEDLSPYRLVIHCAGCMFNRKQMLQRIAQARRQKVPITNYGVTIAYLNNILDRALEIFAGGADRSSPSRRE